MRKIGIDIPRLLSQLGADDEKIRINMRANQVRDRYKQVIAHVYRQNAPLFLAHTNNVFIMDKDGVRTLLVYVDESIYAAELNAQRELIKLLLLKQFAEEIEDFDIRISKGRHRRNHPYPKESESGKRVGLGRSLPLDEDEKAAVQKTASLIDDEFIRRQFERAMTSDLEWKKGGCRIRGEEG